MICPICKREFKNLEIHLGKTECGKKLENEIRKKKAYYYPYREPTDLIVGIDDVTRCPVIGSLICVGVMIQRNELKFLKRLGVKDSKKLTYKKIMELAGIIPKFAKIEKRFISAKMISKSNQKFNLNDMECYAYCSIAKKFLDDFPIAEVQINNFDRSRQKFIWRAKKLGFDFDWNKFIIDHDNETRDIAVGTASIVAKALSIQEYDRFRVLFGDFGSGNPNDKKTIAYLKKHIPHRYAKDKRKRKTRCNGCRVIRWNWATVKRLRKQLSL